MDHQASASSDPMDYEWSPTQDPDSQMKHGDSAHHLASTETLSGSEKRSAHAGAKENEPAKRPAAVDPTYNSAQPNIPSNSRKRSAPPDAEYGEAPKRQVIEDPTYEFLRLSADGQMCMVESTLIDIQQSCNDGDDFIRSLDVEILSMLNEVPDLLYIWGLIGRESRKAVFCPAFDSDSVGHIWEEGPDPVFGAFYVLFYFWDGENAESTNKHLDTPQRKMAGRQGRCVHKEMYVGRITRTKSAAGVCVEYTDIPDEAQEWSGEKGPLKRLLDFVAAATGADCDIDD